MMGTEDLRHEHNEIGLMLDVLGRICERLDVGENVDPEHLKQIHDFMVVFVDKCHHTKEEELLFPKLESIDGAESEKLIGVLIAEHRTGRKYANAIGEAISNHENIDLQDRSKIIKYGRNYIKLLVQHIDKENNVLFTMAEKKLSGKQNQELFEEFEVMEKEKIGIGEHEQLHRMLHNLADIYL
ncbi:hemerythrin domain-containing protein [Methanomethylovorans sp.]|uniref:hemerythrin domain-containing protein n=1 Tax=Methanomethylovorans sp. TaxID=2758717 RepID=UPI00351C01F9